jgi:hypothetical protein
MIDPGLPPIEQWWPHLDIMHKHQILADLDAALSPVAIEAVWGLTGETPPFAGGTVHLSAAEKSYILTQVEAVD